MCVFLTLAGVAQPNNSKTPLYAERLPFGTQVSSPTIKVASLPHVPDKPLKAQNGARARVVLVLGKVSGNGSCVAYAKSLGFRVSGNANLWPQNALVAGYRVDKIPEVGAIIVTKESSYGANTGHVTGAIQKIEDGYAYISEGNYVSGRVTEGWILLSKAIAFIHP